MVCVEQSVGESSTNSSVAVLRNYTPRDRPSAEDILGDFCRSERQLLSWRKTDGNSSSSKTLGAPLSEGRELYRDLQCTYTNT